MTVVTTEMTNRTSGPKRRTGHLGRSTRYWPVRQDASSSQRSYNNLEANYLLACQTDRVKMNIWTEAPGTGRFTQPPTGQFVTAFIQSKEQITSWLADNIWNDEWRLSLAQSDYVVAVAPMLCGCRSSHVMWLL